MAEFTKRLKDIREDNDLNQTELARRIKSTQKTISNWEKGYSEPNIEMIKELCKFFGVTSDYLLGLTDINTEKQKKIIKNQVNIGRDNNGNITMK